MQLQSPISEKIEKAVRLGFSASNNESEYEAILAGINPAASVFAHQPLFLNDSQLVVGQVNTEFES